MSYGSNDMQQNSLQNNNKNNSQENKNYKYNRYFHKHNHYKHYNNNNNNNNSNKQENISKNVLQNNQNKKHRYFRFRKHHRHFHSHNLNENFVKQNKTLVIVIVTLITMIMEICFGFFSGSMALLADGIHMGTHAFALFLSFLAYVFISKIAGKKNHKTVSKKISALAGYTSALILLFSAVWIFKESITRFLYPIKVSFNEAILVAIIGFIVNIVCLSIMYDSKNSKKDFNFKAAYLHIATDALTSIFAIVALISAKLFELKILDPLMGLIAGILILRWSINIIKESSKELMDIKLLS